MEGMALTWPITRITTRSSIGLNRRPRIASIVVSALALPKTAAKNVSS